MKRWNGSGSCKNKVVLLKQLFRVLPPSHTGSMHPAPAHGPVERFLLGCPLSGWLSTSRTQPCHQKTVTSRPQADTGCIESSWNSGMLASLNRIWLATKACCSLLIRIFMLPALQVKLVCLKVNRANEIYDTLAGGNSSCIGFL